MPHGIEIERKYLLDGVPVIPPGAVAWRIEQGYLSPQRPPDQASGATSPADLEFAFGRLRRTVMPDGAVVYTHTLKTGTGMQRLERERTISAAEFDRHWPRTAGRRLSKTRWRVPYGSVTWEVDDIENARFVLAEVEMETPEQAVTPPQWLAQHIVREVTDDPTFTNSSIAERLSRG